MRPPARRHPADDPYAAPPAPGNTHWPPAQHPDPAHVSGQQGQGYHFPPGPEPNYGYGQQQPYDRYQSGAAPDPYAQQQWDQGDARGYDLGNYMPNGQQPYPPAGPPPFHQSAHADEPFAQHGYGEAEGEYDDEFVDEEPGRGRRWMFIVAALVGAVGVGGALAYTYKSFIAPTGRVPLVKADPNVKVRPDARGVAPSDKRMQGRLGDETGGQQQATAAAAAPVAPEAQDDRSGADEPGGPRRVRTIAITPGGGPPPSVQVAPPAAPQAGPPPSVPGIMLDNMGPRPQPQAAPKPGPPPQRVTIGQPPPPRQADEPAPPPARKAAPATPPAAKPAPKVAAAVPTTSTGAGYVAVLSSQKTRMDALKAFADLQQKYGEALSGRVPDVQEANLGEKGIWYRVVVGPPGSREAANGVCSQLKSAGYAHCWVNAY